MFLVSKVYKSHSKPQFQSFSVGTRYFSFYTYITSWFYVNELNMETKDFSFDLL